MGSGSSKTKSKEPENSANVTKHATKDQEETKKTQNEPNTKEEENEKVVKNSAAVEIIQTDENNSITVVSTIADIDEEKGTVTESEVSYAEFPTHVSLRLANEKHKNNHKVPKKNKDGILPPFPSYKRKKDIWNKEKCEKLDKLADQAPNDLLQKSIEEVVNHFVKASKTDLDKARLFFRWLATRDLNNLPKPSDGQANDSLLLELIEIQSQKDYGRYTDLYIKMCRAGGLQVQEIKGKVRTKCELNMVSEVDNVANTWVAVVIDSEWRFVDVQFAAVKVSGGGQGEWELIDDTNKAKKKEGNGSQNESTVYECDDYYFLTNPEEFIYNHRPFEDAWQLLARPVTFSEFQQMAFLRSSFFEKQLTIGEQTKYMVDAFDGEIEIQCNVLKDGKYRFMYNLWKSTKGGQSQAHGGHELSQFVLLHQKESSLRCKVIFPASGDYKLDIFGRLGKEGSDSYDLVCSYIIKVDEPKENLTAFPKNPRSEWGVTHDMDELGLIPITHKDATIETDNGTFDMKFSCTKDPVDCQITLRSNKDPKGSALQRNFVFRQNENKQVVINGKLPEAGLYAIDIQGKKFGLKEDKFPVVATYLIASSSGAIDKTLYPSIHKQLAGQTEENLSMKLSPKQYKESLITFNDMNEMRLEFDTPTPVSAKGTLKYHSDDGKEENVSEYSFRSQDKSMLCFTLRFVRAGMYTFDVYAKPEGSGNSFPLVYTYVINALQPNAKWQPFPKAYDKWGAGCLVNFNEGQTDDKTDKEFKVTVPGAEEVAVITADEKWTNLTKGANDTFTGTANTGPAGTMSIYAQQKGQENFSALLEYKVKPTTQLKKEAEERAKIEALAKEKEAKRLKEEEELKKNTEKEVESTKQELMEATTTRNTDALKKVIAKVEKKNFTGRLEKEYTKAKEVKKSLDKIERLSKLILTMDKKTMAVIRSYGNPPPIVHVTMRATFLLLGNPLKETKEWKRCQALCNSIELNKRIRAFDIKNVSKENAKKTKCLLGPIRLEEVENISAGASCFYSWAAGIAEEVLSQ